MKRNITGFASLILLLAGVAGVLQQLDQRYATAAEVSAVSSKVRELSVEQRRHRLVVRLRDIRSRIWAVEDRWADKFSAETGRIHDTIAELVAFMTPEARADYRALVSEKRDIERQIVLLDNGGAE